MPILKCSICGRPISADESISRGVGSKCAAKYAAGIQAAGTSVVQIEAFEDSNNADVVERVRRFKLAIGARRMSEAKFWLERAEEFAAAA